MEKKKKWWRRRRERARAGFIWFRICSITTYVHVWCFWRLFLLFVCLFNFLFKNDLLVTIYDEDCALSHWRFPIAGIHLVHEFTKISFSFALIAKNILYHLDAKNVFSRIDHRSRFFLLRFWKFVVLYHLFSIPSMVFFLMVVMFILHPNFLPNRLPDLLKNEIKLNCEMEFL